MNFEYFVKNLLFCVQLNSAFVAYDGVSGDFQNKIIQCKDIIDRLIINYAILEDTLCNMASKKDEFNSDYVNRKFPDDQTCRYYDLVCNSGKFPRSIIVSNPWVVMLACEHLISDIECYAEMHSVKQRDFIVPGDLKCSYLKKLQNNNNRDNVDDIVVDDEMVDGVADHQDRNLSLFPNVIGGLCLKVEINTRGKLQKILLCDGPALNVGAVVATKFSGKWKNLQDVPFGCKNADFLAFVDILVDKGVCKIRYHMCNFLFD